MKFTAAVAFVLSCVLCTAQVQFHTEARFCGMEKCRSAIFEVNSPYLELWTRFENYPSFIKESNEFPAINSNFGYSAVAGVGLPQAKVILGTQNGEFIKGIHLYGEDEASTFRTTIVLFHKPSFPDDAFRLDGELYFEKYFPNSFKTRSARNAPAFSWGAIGRLECYEPTPLVIHTGLALRRTSDQKSVTASGRRPGGDFLDSFDPAFMNQFKGTSFTTDWSIMAGPSVFFNGTYGANLSVQCHF